MNNTQGQSEISDIETRRDGGFTLVEILIAMVLIGILSAVVVVGISNLTSKGAKSACAASMDAAQAGSVIYYSQAGNVWPSTLWALTQPIPPSPSNPEGAPAALTLPDGITVDEPRRGDVTYNPMITKGASWTLTMLRRWDGSTAPMFSCIGQRG